MENLEKRIEDSFKSVKFNDYTPLEISQISHKWAEEVREITIEFAKYYIKQDCAKLNNPIAMQLSYLDLESDSELYFDKFIEEYYE